MRHIGRTDSRPFGPTSVSNRSGLVCGIAEIGIPLDHIDLGTHCRERTDPVLARAHVCSELRPPRVAAGS